MSKLSNTVGLLALAVSACGDPAGDVGATEAAATLMQEQMLDLAYAYMHEEIDPANPTGVFDRIRSLRPTQAKELHRALVGLNQLSGVALSLADAGFEVAAENGVAFFELDAELAAEAAGRVPFVQGDFFGRPPVSLSRTPHELQRPKPVTRPQLVDKASCSILHSTCQVDPNFDAGYAMVGASCAEGCVNASAVDRKSNEVCELGGCDYRVIFPAPLLRLIDGRTPAGICAVSQFSEIGAYSASGKSFALLGYGSIALGCLFSDSAVSASLFRAFSD